MKRQLVAPRFAASRLAAWVHTGTGVHVAADAPRRGLALVVHEEASDGEMYLGVLRSPL